MVDASRDDRPRLGFIGLGIMGSPMAGHLFSAGFPLCVFDIDPAAAERLRSRFAELTVAESSAAVGASSDIVVTMLPDGREVQRAALGPDGLAETMRAGSMLLDTSSAQPWLTLGRPPRWPSAASAWSMPPCPERSGEPSRPSWSSWSVAPVRTSSGCDRSSTCWVARCSTLDRSARATS